MNSGSLKSVQPPADCHPSPASPFGLGLGVQCRQRSTHRKRCLHAFCDGHLPDPLDFIFQCRLRAGTAAAFRKGWLRSGHEHRYAKSLRSCKPCGDAWSAADSWRDGRRASGSATVQRAMSTMQWGLQWGQSRKSILQSNAEVDARENGVNPRRSLVDRVACGSRRGLPGRDWAWDRWLARHQQKSFPSHGSRPLMRPSGFFAGRGWRGRWR